VAPSFPVALHLEGKSCLVVGGTLEARDRARALHEAGARVEVVAETPCAELSLLLKELALQHQRRGFDPADLDGKWLAVLVERDLTLGARMAALCEDRRILFCATDQPQRNSYSHMALARAGVVAVAISTNGRAPALGRRLREEFERLLAESGLAAFAQKLAELRDRTPDQARREVLGAAVSDVRLDGRLVLPKDSQ
jgi:precorrin-2 dehydrogenase/sirohydrochlorin ferrochelatase